MTTFIFFLLLFSVLAFEFIFSQIKIKGKIHKKHHFSFSRYVFYLMFLIISTVFILFREGTPLIITILMFSIVGPFFEWLVGISYYKIVGQKLWTYHRGTVHGYTSFFAIPLWIFCGVISWIIIKHLV